jgi:hypothetical protein
MNFKRLLNTETGKTLISILLGLGLASIFREACDGDKCLKFEGPILDEVEGKVFQQGNKCYTYKSKRVDCNKTKKVVPFTSQSSFEQFTDIAFQNTA